MITPPSALYLMYVNENIQFKEVVKPISPRYIIQYNMLEMKNKSNTNTMVEEKYYRLIFVFVSCLQVKCDLD